MYYKKGFFFILLLLLTLFSFKKQILTFFLIKNISNWTEYQAKLEISKFDIINGKLEISNFKLKNKNQFFYENIFESRLLILDFNYRSLFSDLVIINKMTLISPKIYFEIKKIDLKKNQEKKITDNLDIIETISKKKVSKIYPKKNKDKNFIITILTIKNSNALIKHPLNDINLDINLSEMSFNKVGNAGIKNNNNFQHYKDVLKIIFGNILLRIPDYNLRNFIKKNYKID